MTIEKLGDLDEDLLTEYAMSEPNEQFTSQISRSSKKQLAKTKTLRLHYNAKAYCESDIHKKKTILRNVQKLI